MKNRTPKNEYEYQHGFSDAECLGNHPDQLLQEQWNYRLELIAHKYTNLSDQVECFKHYKQGVLDYYAETNQYQ
jgi:hypothetical protein